LGLLWGVFMQKLGKLSPQDNLRGEGGVK
jgi:hypothetical protein